MKSILKCLFILLCFSILNVNADETQMKDQSVFYFDEVYKTDEGYSSKENITKGDPHFGWKLGKFVISGFTDKRNDSNGELVFLKNVGDKITLSFNLIQDINKLNGKSGLVINDDIGYDNEFGIDNAPFGKGFLIIRKIDSNGNKNNPEKYENYLNGVTVNANTKIEAYEEGDYEVALDYELKDNGFLFFDGYPNYRIRFNFKVRNGNSMGFIFDKLTKNEIYNGTVANNGFYIDLANSKYLQVMVKREIYVQSADGYTTDIRFNRPAKDLEEFSEDGVYTITYENVYTGDPTIKKIYIGNDKILKAHVKTGREVNEIVELQRIGAEIDDNGNITNIPNNYSNNENDKLISIISVGVISIIVILFIIFEIQKAIKIKKRAKELAIKNKQNPDYEEIDEDE